MTDVTITAQHITEALTAVDGAIYLAADGTVYATSQVTPADGPRTDLILATADDLGYWIAETGSLAEAAEALTQQIRINP